MDKKNLIILFIYFLYSYLFVYLLYISDGRYSSIVGSE